MQIIPSLDKEQISYSVSLDALKTGMQETIIKYLTGLPENASRWQKKLNKKYGNLTQVTKRIQYDFKHGVERQEVVAFLALIKIDQSYLSSGKQVVLAIDYTLEASLLNDGFKSKSFFVSY